jgi:uncharacterized protein (DUF885 family)
LQRERLRSEAARVFTGQVAPSLRRLHEYLATTYLPRARESIALSDLPDGRAWYAFELRVNTTTDFSSERIHDQVLGHGQLPLDLLDKSIRAWVAEEKAAGRAPG